MRHSLAKCRILLLSRVVLNEALKCFFALNRYAFLQALDFAFGQGRCENIEYLIRLVLVGAENRYPAAVVTQSIFLGRVGRAFEKERGCQKSRSTKRKRNGDAFNCRFQS